MALLLLSFATLCIILATAQSPFTLTAYLPGTSIDGQAINAAGQAFYIGLEGPLSYCPLSNQTLCPSGSTTIFGGMGALFVEVPGGEEIYTASNGALSFTAPHSAFIPPGAFIGDFTNITVKSACAAPFYLINWQSPPIDDVVTGGILACPRVSSSENGTATMLTYQIFAKTPAFNETGCLTLDGLLPQDSPPDVFGAWEYT